MIGTVFFAVVQKSLNEGSRQGLFFTLGIGLSDFLMVAIVVFGSSFIPFLKSYSEWAKIIGGLFLSAYGLYSILFLSKGGKKIEKKGGWKKSTSNVAIGFFLNLLNPANFVAWASLAIYLKTIFNCTYTTITIFLCGCIGLIVFVECLAIFHAKKLNRWFTTERIKRLNILIGLFFIGGGIGILVY